MEDLPRLVSKFVTIVVTVPETHAHLVREALGRAGAGKAGNYSYCSFSTKGIGRFTPNGDADPYLGQTGIPEEVPEERIETICSYEALTHALTEVRKVHPYEEPGIGVYPHYEIECKTKGKEE